MLQPAINLGLNEFDFWDMTVAEITRYINGANWRMKQKASFDYQLANMIGIANARILSNEVKFPAIEEVYPNLFEEEIDENKKKQAEEEERMRKSQNNFMAFALKFNAQKRRGDET